MRCLPRRVALALVSIAVGCASTPQDDIAWRLVDANPAVGTTSSDEPPPVHLQRAASQAMRGPARAVINDDTRYTFARPGLMLVARYPRFDIPDADRFELNIALPRPLQGCDHLLAQIALARIASPNPTARDTRWVVGRCIGTPVASRLLVQAPVAAVLRGTTADVWVQVRPTPPQMTERRRFLLEHVPQGARLDFSYGIESPGWEPGAPAVTFSVGVDRESAPLFSARVDPAADPAQRRWFDATVDLSRYAGSSITLTLQSAQAREITAGTPTVPVWGDPVIVVPGTRERKAPRNLLLISIDTLRAASVSAYGRARPTSPFFDALAREGALFEQTVAQSTVTPVSHMSLFTGLYPSQHGVTGPRRQSNVFLYPTMAEVFRANGYATAAVTEDGLLQAGLGFERGFDRYLESKSPNVFAPVGQVTTTFAAALEWLQAHRTQRWFLFVHTYQVHAPYTPPPQYEGLFGDRDIDRYEEEIRYTDDQLRELWRGIGALGLTDDTLLIVTSDHGEEFGEHGVIRHGSHLYDETLLVPLLMRAPGRIPARLRVSEPVGLIDVFPTVAEILGLPGLFFPDGRSLASLFEAERPPVDRMRWFLARRDLFAEAWSPFRMLADHTFDRAWHPPLFALRTGQRKLIWSPERAESPARVEVFDLDGDRDEQHDLAASASKQFSTEIDALRRYVDAASAASGAGAPPSAPP